MRRYLVLAPLYYGVRAALLVLLLSGAIGCATGETHVANPSSARHPVLEGRESPTPTMPVASETPRPTDTAQLPTSTPRPSRTPTVTPSLTATPLASKTPTVPLPLIAIDPGHGGIDLGARHFDAQGHMDWNEAQVNLDLALRLRDLLVGRGYRVMMTRDGDYSVHEVGEDVNGDGHHEYVVDENQARIDLINEAGADLLLSIHQNAYEGQGAEDVGGTVTYYCGHRPFSDRSLRFAQLVQRALIETFQSLGHDIRDRGVQSDLELQTADHPGRHIILLGPKTERIVRPCQVPGILSESLFITHRREAELARDSAALDAIAKSFADAIDAYFAQEATGMTPTPAKAPQ